MITLAACCNVGISVRKKFFTEGAVRMSTSTGCPASVGAPALQVLKARLDGALGSLSWRG